MPVKRSGGDPSGAPKRTRFASPSNGAAGTSSGKSRASAGGGGGGVDREVDVDDQYLEADITESSRKAKSKERRQLRDQDGYGSDSSNDEEGVVPSRRPGADKDDEDEDGDVDMFADEPAEDKDKGKGKGKDGGGGGKDKEFMDLEEIEGQEFRKADAVDNDESDSETEGGSAENKKKKEGLDGDMGVDLTPFNMKSEMESGRFTAGGEAYIENEKDPGDKHDMWLDEVDKDEIKKARRAHRERERIEREREQREAELEGSAEAERREHELMRQAVQLMERGETVLEALQRIGKETEEKRKHEEAAAAGTKKKSWAERQKERKAIIAKEQEESSPFTALSDIVSALTTIGHLDVYSLSRESIQRMLPAPTPNPTFNSNGAGSARSSAPPPPPPDTRQFQYRFSLAYVRSLPESQRPVEREVFGPFNKLQLDAWKLTGFFGPGCQNVEVRLLVPGQAEQPWGPWDQIIGA